MDSGSGAGMTDKEVHRGEEARTMLPSRLALEIPRGASELWREEGELGGGLGGGRGGGDHLGSDELGVEAIAFH